MKNIQDFPISINSVDSNAKRPKKLKSESMLSKAINDGNKDYIIQFIMNTDSNDDIYRLDEEQTNSFVGLLLDLLDTPYKTRSIESIYDVLINSHCNMEIISKQLINFSSDLNKLAYLKGKIDYLKRRRRFRKQKIENIIE